MSSMASSNKRELLDDLKQFARKMGKTPTKRELTKCGPHSVWKYSQEFGSWNAALKAADLSPNLVRGISSDALKKDIERVAGILDKPPSLSEMNRLGKYSSATYTRKLDSYVETLEKLGLDPAPDQYNPSSHETPCKKQGTKNVRKLRKCGPLPASELPHNVGRKDKRHGMARFSIKNGQSNRTESVVYIFEEHDPKQVLRVFFEAHPEVAENRSSAQITKEVGKYGPQWKKSLQYLRESINYFL